MLVKPDTKYKKICKENNYDPENKDEKKGRKINNNNGTALAANANGIFNHRC